MTGILDPSAQLQIPNNNNIYRLDITDEKSTWKNIRLITLVFLVDAAK